MREEEKLKSPASPAEVQTQKRKTHRSQAPVAVSDVEDHRCYTHLMERLFEELGPSNVQQEGDLISLGQLRWSAERTHNLIEHELNHRLRGPLMQKVGDSGVRLMLAYRNCLGERTFNLLTKQHLDTIKTLNTLSARIEKWATPKTPRSSRTREI